MSSKTDKQGVVPRLRFPEFRNAGPWEVMRLGDVLEEHGLKSSGEEEVYSVSVHKGFVNQIEHLGRSFSAKNTDHYNRVLHGDVVYTKSPTGNFPFGIIKQNKSGRTVIVSPLYGVFSPTSYALGTVIDAYFESPFRTAKYLEPLVQKGAKNTINISNDRFLSGALPLPLEKGEQQKIADCLYSLDEVIALEAQKLEALRQHKKGLMQQLFPQEGETIPRLRFPEFRNAGPWEVQTIGDIFRVTRGQVLSMELVAKDYSIENPYPVYSSQTINEGLAGYYRNYLFENAITWTTDGANAGFVKYRIGKFYCTNVCGVLLNDDGYANQCVSEILNSVARKHVSYVGNPKLMNNAMAKIQIPLPSLQEQQKIADCLSSLDEVIALQSQKLEALKQHKKGLMQQLFPQEVD